MTTRWVSSFMAGVVWVGLANGEEIPPPRLLPPTETSDVLPPISPAPSPVLPGPSPILSDPSPVLPAPTPVPTNEAPVIQDAATIMPPGPIVDQVPPVTLEPDRFPPGSYPASFLQFRLSYLSWWLQDDHYPTFLTVGSSSDADPGELGQENTEIITANLDHEDIRPGLRLHGTYLLDYENQTTLEIDVLLLQKRNLTFSALLDDSDVLARVYYDPESRSEATFLVFAPNDNIGGTALGLAATDLLGTEVNVRYRFPDDVPPRFVSFLAGLRYLQLNDHFRVEELTTQSFTLTPVDNRADYLQRVDEFNSHNRFLGPQVGAEAEWIYDRFWCSLFLKVALGLTHQSNSVQGATLVTDGGPLLGPFPVGFLTQFTNIGEYDRARFGVIPEFGFNMGYQVTDYCRITVGYNYLYWWSVARAGDQVDRVVNLSQSAQTGSLGTLVGPARPLFFFRESGFWAQGVNFSIEIRY